MITGYIYDPERKKAANAGNENYWYEYIKEICEQIGLRAKPVSSSVLANTAALNSFEVLILGGLPESCITEDIRRNLDQWVSEGGVLIGLAVEGLDDVFGVERNGITRQMDDYAASAYFRFTDDKLTEGIHSFIVPEQELLIFSHVHHAIPKAARSLATLHDLDRKTTRYAAITHRIQGGGHAFYFAFDLAKTIWILHQGRPVTEDLDGDGLLKTMEMHAIGDNSGQVAYADELLFLLQNMIGRKPQPFIYPIPPDGNKIPDAMLFWGGDDEGVRGLAVTASNWMKEKGLPYHANIMYKGGGFDFTLEDAETMVANGHEYSLHYDFLKYKAPGHFGREDVLEQADAFYKKFGRHQICSVNHYAMWTQWTDPAEWMLEAGGQADNTFMSKFRVREHVKVPTKIPLRYMDADFYYARPQFGFGTCYPFYFYTDYTKGNSRIDFLELPIAAYEMGYRGNGNEDTVIFPDEIHTIIDMAVRYHFIINLFYHPVYICERQGCRNAIEEEIDYIDSNKLSIIHKGPDAVCLWWKARSKANIEDVEINGDGISFSTDCDYEDGMIVRVPLGESQASSVVCDGSAATYENKWEFGQNWVYMICPNSRHKMAISTR